MFEGILPIYKERGITSHDVVFRARRILQMKNRSFWYIRS